MIYYINEGFIDKFKKKPKKKESVNKSQEDNKPSFSDDEEKEITNTMNKIVDKYNSSLQNKVIKELKDYFKDPQYFKDIIDDLNNGHKPNLEVSLFSSTNKCLEYEIEETELPAESQDLNIALSDIRKQIAKDLEASVNYIKASADGDDDENIIMVYKK